MNNKFLNRLKIFGVLVLAVAIVKFLSPQIFLANTPNIKSQFISFFNNLKSYRGTQVAAKVMPSAIPEAEKPKNPVLTEIGKGVFAAEDKETKKTYIMYTEDAKFEVHEYTLKNNQKITLYIPVK